MFRINTHKVFLPCVKKSVAFNKDIEELTAKIKSLNKEKISLNIDAVKAQQTLRDLQQQFKNTGQCSRPNGFAACQCKLQ